MAKKTNTSPDTTSSRDKAPAVPPKREADIPKHRRAQSKTSETAAVERTPATVEKSSEPVSSVSSHHLDVSREPETPKFTISHEDIATLAFSYWERRGYQGGSAEEDWTLAEQELRSFAAGK